jgi:stringent starvation protein B
MRNEYIEDPKKPYLINAVYKWCIDSEMTPWVVANLYTDDPIIANHAVNNQVIFNLSPQDASNVCIDENYISFRAVIAGNNKAISIPVAHVCAVFAKEVHDGMEFAAATGIIDIEDEQESDYKVIKLVDYLDDTSAIDDSEEECSSDVDDIKADQDNTNHTTSHLRLIK